MEKNLYIKALKILTRREYSRAELAKKLQLYSLDVRAISVVLDQLSEQDLQSDLRFAECYVYFRSGRGFGPLKIDAELRERGVSWETIEQALQNSKIDWLLLSKKVRDKKFGRKIPSAYLEQAKQMRFLQYRGFKSEMIRDVFAEHN